MRYHSFFPKRHFAVLARGAGLALAWLILGAMHSEATISVISYWRMGENDPGAFPGVVATNLVDSAGTNNLTVSGQPVYSADVAVSAASDVGSWSSLDFGASGGIASCPRVSTTITNFGVECWVKPSANVTTSQVIAYNGNTGINGWGIFVANSEYSGLFGNVTGFTAGSATPNTWTHVALVRNQGTTTFYINGIATATNSSTPLVPGSKFAVAQDPQGGGGDSFTGEIDEVRVFTFASGQFSTNDLLLNAHSLVYSVGTSALAEGPAQGTDTVTVATAPTNAWTAVANSSWLHLTAANQSGSGSTNVAFSFDTNPGPTRSGTLTLAGETVNVTQAGSNFVSVAGIATVLASGLNSVVVVAADSAGNIYIANTSNGTVQKVAATNNSLTTLISSGLSSPQALAVDAAGNLYIADSGLNAVMKWTTNGTLSTLVSGLAQPHGVAVDGAGNVFIADYGANMIVERVAATGQVTNLITSGLLNPSGVAVDVAENLFIADFNDKAVKKWTAAGGLTTLVTAGLGAPMGVAVDGGGNVYYSDYANGLVGKWTARTGTVAMLVSNLTFVRQIAVDAAANVYIADFTDGQVKKLNNAFVDPTPRTETSFGGSDTLLPVVPATANLHAPMTGSDQSWLTINGTSGGAVQFGFTVNEGATRAGHLIVLGQSISVTQGGPIFSLGASSLVVGPGAGSNCVVLAAVPSTGTWTATTNAPWLHLATLYQSGVGSFNIIFSFDANPGTTRNGTLTIAGQTFTVTQAGSTYISARPSTALVSQGLNGPQGVAMDAAGNVYIADCQNQAIEKWNATNGTLTTLVSSGLSTSFQIAVDAAGNIYISDYIYSVLRKWTAATGTLDTLVVSGLNRPYGVALDSSGNVYIADSLDNAIKEWSPATQTLSSLPIGGLSGPMGVAVDLAGNIYIADTGNQAVREWNTSAFEIFTLVSGLNHPIGVAVDGWGNVYVADSSANVIDMWPAAGGAVASVPFSGLNSPSDVAVDALGNVYAPDTGNSQIKEVPRAFVDPTQRTEIDTGASDALPTVLPATESLNAPFVPFATQPWVSLTSVSNDVVSFSVTPGFTRVAGIVLMGQFIPVVQEPPVYSISTPALLEGPSAGTDSVVLAMFPPFAPWTNTPNAGWLHPGPASGIGSGLIRFTFDTNSGPTRTGTMNISGQLLSVTQAGSTYIPTTNALSLTPSDDASLSFGADNAGNVYLANGVANTIVKGSEINQAIYAFTNFFTGNFNNPFGVALDSAGNLYISDTQNGAIKMWNPTNQIVTTLASNLNLTLGIAVDRLGDVYFSDSAWPYLYEWMAASNAVVPLNQGGSGSIEGVAVDHMGNVFFADIYNNQLKELSALDGSVSNLISGMNSPSGVAVDVSGNVYVVDDGNRAVRKWTAASGAVTTIVSQGLNAPVGVAVDSAENVYVDDPGLNGNLWKLPHAFVNATPRMETAAAGSDTLPAVLPATLGLLPPLNPTNDQPWLTVNYTSNGMVNFSFSYNLGPQRTGDILVLSQPVKIIQSGPSFSLGSSVRHEGPSSGKDSVTLAVVPQIASWTASANASWLHLSAANQSGTGSTNVIFSFDTNSGPTRTSGLTIAGQPYSVIQAGATYVASPDFVTNTTISAQVAGLVSDAAGDIYLAEQGNQIARWNPVTGVTTVLVSSNLINPVSVALDAAGNVYYGDSGNSAIKEWNATNQTVVTIANTTVPISFGLAVDSSGNVYYTGGSAVWEVPAGATNVTPSMPLLIPGLNTAAGLAVDGAGNLFISDFGDNTIKRWTPANQTLTVLVSGGLNGPLDVAVDGGGNVYFVDSGNEALKEWNAASNAVITLAQTGTGPVPGVGVDAVGNAYFASPVVVEWYRSFVDNTPKIEGLAFGTDALPVVLPPTENLTAPFGYPYFDQSWLNITGVTNGVVGFIFDSATSTRTGHINLLGVSIPITQTLITNQPVLMGPKMLANGTFQFSFTNSQTTNFTVFSTTNLSLSFSNWTVVGTPSNISPGLFQFTIPTATNGRQRYFRVEAP